MYFAFAGLAPIKAANRHAEPGTDGLCRCWAYLSGGNGSGIGFLDGAVIGTVSGVSFGTPGSNGLAIPIESARKSPL